MTNITPETRVLLDEAIDLLTPRDSVYFQALFQKNKAGAECLFNAALGRNDIVLKDEPAVEHYLKNLFGDSVRFDLHGGHAVKNEQYDAEMENDEGRANPRRTRMYSSMLDSNTVTKRKDYTDLPDSYVVFFPRTDYYGYGKKRYEVMRIVNDSPYEDGSHIVIVNGEHSGNQDDLAKLMHDLNCAVPEDMYCKPLRERAVKLKETPEGRQKMTEMLQTYFDRITDQIVKDRVNQALKEAVDKAVKETEANAEIKGGIAEKKRIALSMLQKHMPLAEIAEITGLTPEEINALKN